MFVFDVNSDTPVNSGNTTDSIFSPKLSLIFGPGPILSCISTVALASTATMRGGPRSQLIRKRVIRPSVDPLVRSKGAEIGVRKYLGFPV